MMINIPIITAKAILKLFLIIFFAFLATKLKLLTRENSKQLTDIICSFTYPFLIVSCCIQNFNQSTARSFLLCIILSLVFQAVVIVICLYIFPKHKVDYEVKRICSIYGNGGFIGMPIVQSLFGDEGAFYMTAFVISFNILLWTHGVLTLQDNAGKKEIIKSFKSPCLISIIIGLFIYFLRIPVPEIIAAPITLLANCNTPLSMVVAGIAIANSDLIKCFKRADLYIVCLIKQMLMPIITMFLTKLFGCNEIVSISMIIAAACPTAVFTAMNTEKFNKNFEFSYSIFSISTISCLITIPLILKICNF